MKRRLIALMLASGVSIGFITLSLASCKETKSTAEKNCEEKIKRLLEYDAGIDIDNSFFGGGYGEITMQAKNNVFLIKFYAGKSANIYQEITYSVDKDFYYNFKNNFSTIDGQNEVDLVAELTLTYSPIKVIEGGEEQTL